MFSQAKTRQPLFKPTEAQSNAYAEISQTLAMLKNHRDPGQFKVTTLPASAMCALITLFAGFSDISSNTIIQDSADQNRLQSEKLWAETPGWYMDDRNNSMVNTTCSEYWQSLDSFTHGMRSMLAPDTYKYLNPVFEGVKECFRIGYNYYTVQNKAKMTISSNDFLFALAILATAYFIGATIVLAKDRFVTNKHLNKKSIDQILPEPELDMIKQLSAKNVTTINHQTSFETAIKTLQHLKLSIEEHSTSQPNKKFQPLLRI